MGAYCYLMVFNRIYMNVYVLVKLGTWFAKLSSPWPVIVKIMSCVQMSNNQWFDVIDSWTSTADKCPYPFPKRIISGELFEGQLPGRLPKGEFSGGVGEVDRSQCNQLMFSRFWKTVADTHYMQGKTAYCSIRWHTPRHDSSRHGPRAKSIMVAVCSEYLVFFNTCVLYNCWCG